MKIAFRVDASNQIGTGHFMRCLTLANALQQSGAQIRFVCRHLIRPLRDMLVTKKIEFKLLDTYINRPPTDDLAHAHWLGINQEHDAQDTFHVLSDELWDWLIVDHYALDARWESMLRKTTRNILVIDDIADRKHQCDILLDQNFYTDMESRYTGIVPTHCRLLLGPQYALLRDEFRLLHNQTKPRKGPVKRLLVFFGGIDAENYTGVAIETLSQIDTSNLHVDVVVGTQHPNCDQVKTACAQHGFTCHIQTDKMAELMRAADLAIGAGGSTTWERCCLGLPTLTICTAINQQKQVSNAAQEGILYAPSHGTSSSTIIKKHLTTLLENDHLRTHISRRAMEAVDGQGALRIINVLGFGKIEMRRANEMDSEQLFNWRNTPRIRSVSRQTGRITWEDHQRWFSNVLDSNNRELLIGQSGDLAIGVIRFDKQDEVAEISIYLVPDSNNSGLGLNLLRSGEQWIKKYCPEIMTIRAYVLGDNKPSHRLFLGANYQVKTTQYLKKLL